MGHARPGRAKAKSGDVGYAPIAIKFRSAAKWRDGPNGQRLLDGGRRLMHQESCVDALIVRHGLAEYGYPGRE